MRACAPAGVQAVHAGPGAAPARLNPPEQELQHCRHDTDSAESAPGADDPVWGGGGLLASALPGWRARAGQRALAEAVREAIERRGILLAEAGTGTGKTLGYLVPALLQGERLIVSTATRALQDQLSRKDLPLACQALGLQVRSTVLKGRANYVCLYRLGRARQDGLLDSRRAVQQLREVVRFAAESADGDLSAMPGLDERSSILPLVTSTRDNCLGSECPDYRKCFVMKARREALAADVVVVNHHLFFADLALRGDGVAELLPAATTVVLDEAHQLADTGAQFLGSAVGTAQAHELARDAQACGLQHARGLADWARLGAALVKAARDARLCAGAGAQRLDWIQAQSLPGWSDALRAWSECLDALHGAVTQVEESAPEFSRLVERCQEQQRLLATWQLGPDDAAQGAGEADSVRWLEVGTQHLRLLSTPLGIGPAFSAWLAERAQTWILVSATLTVDGSFRYARARLGLGDGSPAVQAQQAGGETRLRLLRVPSPFDYAAQTRLLVPRHGFHPGHADHPLHVAELAARLIEANGGGSFVLTTTLRAMARIAERLRELLPPGRAVLEQSSEPKAVLLRRFAADPRAVLVGSHSFWEGVDFPGEQLTLVVIDKLPFAPPDDPMVAARLARLEAAGRSGFADYSLPQAALALQQGAGRLVRGEQDWGVLAVCDQRLLSTGWGRRLLGSLPAFTPVQNLESALDFLRSQGTARAA